MQFGGKLRGNGTAFLCTLTQLANGIAKEPKRSTDRATLVSQPAGCRPSEHRLVGTDAVQRGHELIRKAPGAGRRLYCEV
jgi:hypothetical protein